MRGHAFARALAVSAFVITSVAVGSASADEPSAENQKEASERFQHGVELHRDGDAVAALKEFRRAYQLAPNYRVLFNIGQTALATHDYAQALDAFEKYLAEGGADLSAERRVEVDAIMTRVLASIANVTVKVNVAGASVMVDDVAVGTSPLEKPIRVGAGQHRFSASTPDTVPVSRAVEVVGGENPVVALELFAPTRAGKEAAPAVVPDAQPRHTSRTPFWIGVGVTSALAIGTAVMGFVTLSNQSALDDELARYTAEGNGDIRSARTAVKTTAVVFDVLALGTLVAGGVTLVLGLTHESEPAKASAGRPAFRF